MQRNLKLWRAALWTLMWLGGAASAAAQEPCVVNVSIQAGSCSLSPLRSDRDCTSIKYQVETDRDVTIEVGANRTPCPKGTCTLDGGDADTAALTVLDAGGTQLKCVTPSRRPPPPAPAPSTGPSRALLAAIRGTPRPDAGAARGASAAPRQFARLRVEERLQGQATGASQIADDFLRTVAAVALERAQTRAAQRLIDAARDALCGDSASSPRRAPWALTCDVFDHLTPATLGGAAEALRRALAADVGRWLGKNTRLASERDREYLASVLEQTLLPLLTRPGDVQRDELLQLLNAVVSREWDGAPADVYNLAFYLVRVCGAQTERVDCDVSEILDAALPLLCTSKPGLCETAHSQRLRIEVLAGRLSPLLARRPLKSSELRRALRDSVDVVLRLAASDLAPEPSPTALQEPSAALSRPQHARLVLMAMLDDDAFSFALHVGELLESEQLGPKVHALSSAVLSYARTYRQDLPEGEDPAERRKQIVEALVTASTDRSQRGDDWIVSLGVNVGLELTGYQSIDGDGGGFAPQLMMPLGVFVQRGPGGKRPGLHAGLFFADVAQYATYRNDGTTNDPRWDSAIAVGGQAGVILGSIADPFVIGLDARYAPTLFASETSSEPASGGTLRVGVFATYYVSLFDLN